MAQKLSAAATDKIRATIDAATADPKGIPGTVFCCVGKDGKVIFSHASGKRGVDTDEPMTMDNTFWIASCTKMIGGIACMQLVEQGKLKLDDADQVEEICPELKRVQILSSVDKHGKATLKDKTKRITLKLLLTHTSGFGYSFFNDNIKRYGMPVGSDEFSGNPDDILNQPLNFEPGERWEYGVGIDWAGTIVERVSGMSLNDYFQKNIFQPLGIKNVSMFPDGHMKSKLSHMHARDPDGSLRARDHLNRRALIVEGDDIKKTYNSAGAGCFARPEEYCKLLSTLLNDGTSPLTGAQILKPETVQTMFTNQIPQFPNFGRNPIPDVKKDLTNPLPMLYPQPEDQEQGWGLTFMITIHPGATGRGANTGWWAGLPNLFWWADREKGVAGLICSQILPFGDGPVMGLWGNCEAMIYGGLEPSLEGLSIGK